MDTPEGLLKSQAFWLENRLRKKVKRVLCVPKHNPLEKYFPAQLSKGG
jgi:hypothetical protein